MSAKTQSAKNSAKNPFVAPSDESIDLSRFALLGSLNTRPENIENELQKARGPQAMDHLKQRIVNVARTFARDYKLKVLPSQEKRWTLGIDPAAEQAVKELDSGVRSTVLDVEQDKFKPKAILYNVDDLALAPEDYVFRRLRHEATRASVSDLRYLFEGFKQAERRSNSGVAYGLLHTTCEEARVYQREVGTSIAAKEALLEAMQGRLAEIRVRVNQQPLLQQLCLNLLYGQWLQDADLPEIRDQRVLEATKALKPAFERYIFSDNQAENLATLEKEIWPIAEALDGKSVPEEMERLVAENLDKTNAAEVKFKKRLWTRMANGMRRMVFLKPKRFAPPPETGALFKASEGAGGFLLRSALTQKLAAQKSDTELINKNLGAEKKETLALRQALDLERLANERPALQQIIQSLDPAEAARLQEVARQRIQEQQREALRRQLPIGIDIKKEPSAQKTQLDLAPVPPPETIKSQEDSIQELLRDLPPGNGPLAVDGGGAAATSGASTGAAASAATNAAIAEQEAKRRSEIEQELKRRELSKQGFTEEEEQLYRMFKGLESASIRRLEGFLKQLAPLLPKQRSFEFGDDLYYTGARLDKRAVIRRAALRDMQVWQRRVPVDLPDPRMFVTLLIDNSPSMEGTKIEEARKTAIFWGRALKELGIPFAIKYFGGRTFNLKSFNDDYDDPRCRIKPRIISELNAGTSATNISDPLTLAEKEMAMQQRKLHDFFGAIFMISDGDPNRGLVGEELKTYITALRHKYLVMNFSLASLPKELESARYYFGERNVVAIDSFEKLPSESIRILQNVLRDALQRQKQ